MCFVPSRSFALVSLFSLRPPARSMRQTPAAFRKSPKVGASAKSPSKHRRVDSEQFIEPEENMNVSWLHGRGTWLAFILIIAALRLVLSFLPLDKHSQWTLCNSLVCILHYLAIHFNTGVPWTETRLMQGKYDPLTFWESLDIRYDHHKRFLTVVPIVLYLITVNSDSYPPSIIHLAINSAMLAICLVPKFYQSAKNKERRKS